jgi:hypothetical protein
MGILFWLKGTVQKMFPSFYVNQLLLGSIGMPRKEKECFQIFVEMPMPTILSMQREII